RVVGSTKDLKPESLIVDRRMRRSGCLGGARASRGGAGLRGTSGRMRLRGRIRRSIAAAGDRVGPLSGPAAGPCPGARRAPTRARPARRCRLPAVPVPHGPMVIPMHEDCVARPVWHGVRATALALALALASAPGPSQAVVASASEPGRDLMLAT